MTFEVILLLLLSSTLMVMNRSFIYKFVWRDYCIVTQHCFSTLDAAENKTDENTYSIPTHKYYVRGKADTEIKDMGQALITAGVVSPVGRAVDESLEMPTRMSVLPGQESTSRSRFQERNKYYQ